MYRPKSGWLPHNNHITQYSRLRILFMRKLRNMENGSTIFDVSQFSHKKDPQTGILRYVIIMG